MTHQPDLHRDPAESARLQRRTNRRTTAITVAAWATAGAVVVGATQFGWGPFSGGLGGLADIAGGAQGERTTTIAEPVTSLAVTSSNVDVVVRYDDVPSAQIIETDLAEGGLTHRVEAGRLVVAHDAQGSWWRWFSDERLTVVLPAALEADTPDVTVTATTADILVRGAFGSADLTAQTGSVEGEGTYERFMARTTTGSIDLRGTAGEVVAEAQTGSVDVRPANATHVRATTSTGSVDIEVTGGLPTEVMARTGTGSVDIEVPRGAYAVQTDTGTGSADVEVDQDPNSPHRITVETGTGSIDITD